MMALSRIRKYSNGSTQQSLLARSSQANGFALARVAPIVQSTLQPVRWRCVLMVRRPPDRKISHVAGGAGEACPALVSRKCDVPLLVRVTSGARRDVAQQHRVASGHGRRFMSGGKAGTVVKASRTHFSSHAIAASEVVPELVARA